MKEAYKGQFAMAKAEQNGWYLKPYEIALLTYLGLDTSRIVQNLTMSNTAHIIDKITKG